MLAIALMIGVVTAFNLLIIKWKLEDGRYGDVALDLLSLVVLAAMFGNTILGMLIAMVASMCISVYLLVFPPRGYGNV
jgi:hypothetical protein